MNSSMMFYKVFEWYGWESSMRRLELLLSGANTFSFRLQNEFC